MLLQSRQKERIESWQASGLTQVDYCRQHQLNAKTFSNWLRAYRSGQANSDTTTLIPVEIKASVLPDMMKLQFSQGYTLELSTSVSPQWLGQLLKCLN